MKTLCPISTAQEWQSGGYSGPITLTQYERFQHVPRTCCEGRDKNSHCPRKTRFPELLTFSARVHEQRPLEHHTLLVGSLDGLATQGGNEAIGIASDAVPPSLGRRREQRLGQTLKPSPRQRACFRPRPGWSGTRPPPRGGPAGEMGLARRRPALDLLLGLGVSFSRRPRKGTQIPPGPRSAQHLKFAASRPPGSVLPPPLARASRSRHLHRTPPE